MEGGLSRMMSTLIRNVVIVCSLAVVCAALVGCSSSDDDRSAELQQQLDMRADISPEDLADLRAQVEELMGRADISTEDLAALRTQVETLMGRADISPADVADLRGQIETAEQNLIDARVAFAAEEKIRDAASYGAQKTNRDGEIIIVRKLADWDDPHASVTGWLSQIQFDNSGSEYAAMSQSYREGGWGGAVPWYGEDGELKAVAGTGLAHRPLQRDPEIWPFRGIYTPALDRDVPGIASVEYGPIENHGLGSDWQGAELVKTYEGSGTLTFRFFTDLAEADSPGNPYGGNPPADDPSYHNIVLDDIPFPAGWDNIFIPIPEAGLPGSLDGVAGTFSCAGFCALEDGRHHMAPRFTPWVVGDPVVFTPDDGSAAQELPAPRPTEVPTVNYLSFGNWLFVPEDITDRDAYDFGVFAGGDDPFMVDNLQGLAGTANYSGEAGGTYSVLSEAAIGSFNATVDLTADFGTADDFGTIVGRVHDFRMDDGQTPPLTELNLQTASWREGGTTNIHQSYVEGPPLPGGWIEGNVYAGTDTAVWLGVWGGKFFGNGAAASDLPTGFAGTFGATDGDHSFAASFGASQQ